MSDDEDARRALLQHYSSKSSMQATLILSLTIAFFAFLQAVKYDGSDPIKVLYIVATFVSTYLGLRSLGRLLYYGGMADGIVRDQALTVENARKLMENDQEYKNVKSEIEKLRREKGIESETDTFDPESFSRIILAANWDHEASRRISPWRHLLLPVTNGRGLLSMAIISATCFALYLFPQIDVILLGMRIIILIVILIVLLFFINYPNGQRKNRQRYTKLLYIDENLVLEFNTKVAIPRHTGVSNVIEKLMKEEMER